MLWRSFLWNVDGFPPLGKFPWPKEVYPDFPKHCSPLSRNVSPLNLKIDSKMLVFGDGSGEMSRHRSRKKRETVEDVTSRMLLSIEEDFPKKTDRIESWFRILRAGHSWTADGGAWNGDKLEPLRRSNSEIYLKKGIAFVGIDQSTRRIENPSGDATNTKRLEKPFHTSALSKP